MARQSKGYVASKAKSEASKDPSTPSLSYKADAPRWALITAVLGGTETMRAAGHALMPQHEGESDMRYKDRLETAVFTNYTALTVESWVGKPFSRPVVFTEDTDERIKALEDDMNLCGDTLNVVCKDWFTKGIEKRVAYCLVEFPEVQAREDGKAPTLADQERLGLRPYWTILPAEAVISCPKERIDGEDQFVHLRFWDNRVVRDGYEETVEHRIREYNRVVMPDGTVAVTVQTHTKEGSNWTKGQVNTLSQPYITLVAFDTGEMKCKDLAYMNSQHWQSSADQRASLTVARFPILAAKGVDKDTTVVIGPYSFLAAQDPNSEFYYVEHTGAALEAGQKDIDASVESMALYGAEQLMERPDRQTATSAILDTATTAAPLQLNVYAFKSAVEQALYYTKLWMEIDENAKSTIEINTDFALTKEETQKVANLKEARAKGDISRAQFLKGMVEARALPSSFDITANETELQAEALKDGEMAAQKAKLLADATPAPTPGTPQPKKE